VNLIPIADNPEKCSVKPLGVFAASDLILPDASNTKLVTYYSAMRRLSLADGECITRTFQNQSLYTLPDTNQLHLWRKVLSMQLKLSLLYKQ